MTGAHFSPGLSITARDIDDFITAGLGPIMYHVLQHNDRANEFDRDLRLKAADLTSRAISAEQFKNVKAIVQLLQANDIEPVLLKGASFATRYYPEPHQRIMGDVDLLIPPHQIDEAQAILLRNKFKEKTPAEDMDYETHIHRAPLFLPDKNFWVELHRSLLPSSFPASEESPLELSTVDDEIESIDLGELQVKHFRTEFELIYLAAGWCWDLTRGFDQPGLQRSLFDCTLLLKSREESLNWDDIFRWSNETLLGAGLYVLLSFLKRIGVFADPKNCCEVLGKQQSYVNSVSLRLMHNRIDQYLVRFGDYGRLGSPRITSHVFDALMRKSAAWKNLAAIPGNVLFPRREPRRFQLNYQIGRLQKALGRKK